MSIKVTFITDAKADDVMNLLIGLQITQIKIEGVNLNSPEGDKL